MGRRSYDGGIRTSDRPSLFLHEYSNDWLGGMAAASGSHAGRRVDQRLARSLSGKPRGRRGLLRVPRFTLLRQSSKLLELRFEPKPLPLEPPPKPLPELPKPLPELPKPLPELPNPEPELPPNPLPELPNPEPELPPKPPLPFDEPKLP